MVLVESTAENSVEKVEAKQGVKQNRVDAPNPGFDDDSYQLHLTQTVD